MSLNMVGMSLESTTDPTESIIAELYTDASLAMVAALTPLVNFSIVKKTNLIELRRRML